MAKRYNPIMCMNVPDSVKSKDAGGFAQGSKAKIVTENAGTQYESFTVEYGGNPLKRGFKSREAAVKYAKNQGLTVDEKALDKAIRNCDRDPYEYETIKNDIDIAARGKASYITKSSLQSRITRGFQTNRLTKEQKEELWRLAESVKQ